MKRCICGNGTFLATQSVSNLMNVIVDANNNFIDNQNEENDSTMNPFCESEDPQGPYICSECKRSYEDLGELENADSVFLITRCPQGDFLKDFDLCTPIFNEDILDAITYRDAEEAYKAKRSIRSSLDDSGVAMVVEYEIDSEGNIIDNRDIACETTNDNCIPEELNKDAIIKELLSALSSLVGDGGEDEDECYCHDGHKQCDTVCQYCYAKNIFNKYENY